MKKKSLLIGLVFTALTVGAVTSSFAMGHGYRNSSSRGSEYYCSGYGSVSRTRGYDLMNNILTEKYDLTQEYIDGCYEDGDTLLDILKNNDIDQDEFRNHFSDARIAEVDEALKNGDITETEAEDMKANIKDHMENFDMDTHMGMMGRRGGNGSGRRGRGYRGGCH